MRIAFVSDQIKRELMINLCVAYKMLLKKHELYATQTTGTKIEEATGLTLTEYLPGPRGGAEQLLRQIERDELDAVIYFHQAENPEMNLHDSAHSNFFPRVVKDCDVACIPLATNIATAEAIILGIDAGDLDWRQ